MIEFELDGEEDQFFGEHVWVSGDGQSTSEARRFLQEENESVDVENRDQD